MPQRSSRTPALTPEEFAECFQDSARKLWCLAAAVTGDRSVAEDVLQDAALVGLQKLDSFRPGTRFDAWMAQIVRYTALNQSRRNRSRPRSLSEAAAAGAEPAAAPARSPAPPGPPAPGAAAWNPDHFDERVARALAALKEVPRTCLLLKTVMELEYREIAALLGLAEGTAMSHVHRARGKMRHMLGDDPSRGALAKRRAT